MATLYPTTATPPQLRESVWLAGAFLSSVSYGIVFTLSILNFYLLFERSRGRKLSSTSAFRDKGRRRHHLFLILYIIMLFSMSTLFMTSQAEKTRLAFVTHRDYPGGPSAYQSDTLNSPMSTLGIVPSSVINWLSDGLLLWQCFAFYRSSSLEHLQWVMLPPALMYVCSIATGVYIDILFVKPSTPGLRTLTLIYGSMSVGLNTLLTFMIIIRLYLLRRSIARCLGPTRNGPGTSDAYTTIMAMMIESASIFVVVVILYLIPLGMKSVLSVIPSMVMSQIQATSSLMIIFRVAQGTTEIVVRDMTSPLHCGGDVSEIRFTQSQADTQSATQHVNAACGREEHINTEEK